MRDGHLAETLRRIIAEALTHSVKDPRIGFVTISEVRLNRDNTMATVYYTVLGEEADKARSLNGLRSCARFLHSVIDDQIRLRVVPKLYFRYDESLDRSFRLDEVLDDVIPEEEPSSGEAQDELASEEQADQDSSRREDHEQA